MPRQSSESPAVRILALSTLSVLLAAALFLALVAGRAAWDVCAYHWLPDARQAVSPR